MAENPAHDPEECAYPGCNESRTSLILGWHGNDLITSAYCDKHGPRVKRTHCSECGTVKSSRKVWPDGVPPMGILKGELGAVRGLGKAVDPA